ncbi:MAG: Glu-tRNA(Gln) amidotransferase subunit GatE [Candidatus Thorarchaeota archaeon]
MKSHQEDTMKAGLELHIQLDTGKLFCDCRSELHEEDPDYIIRRKLKAVAGELGEIDIAAAAEEARGKTFHYEAHYGSVCTIELDEEPPHLINQDALEVALTIARLLNMKPVEEIHIMRKTVIDGSNTTGFQRTAFLARDGYIDTTEGRIRVNMLCLEEDAARKMHERADKIFFRLDRLGIPLVELRTEPDIKSPKQVQECAERLGLLTRMTGKVKRGIGTIRQDLNVSIPGGARVEIKGAQDLAMFPKIVEIEIKRQKTLLEISETLKKRKITVKDLERAPVDVTEVLSKSESDIARRGLKGTNIALSVKLPGFGGLLGLDIGPDRRFGTELADHVRKETGLRGLLHSDELQGYGITGKETEAIAKALDATSSEDGYVIVLAEKVVAQKAIHVILNRARSALNGVPREVRGPNQDGTSSYQRPMPGGARMYPETDHPPIIVSEDLIQRIDSNLPETPDQKLERFVKEGLGSELASQIIRSRKLQLFENLAKNHEFSSKYIASLLLSVDSELKKEHNIEDPSILTHSQFSQVFDMVEQGEIAKSAVVPVLASLLRDPHLSAPEVISKIGVKRANEEEIVAIIEGIVQKRRDFIKERRLNALGPLMGMAMKELAGKVEGKEVSDLLKREIQKMMAANSE